MKQQVEKLLHLALEKLKKEGLVPADTTVDIHLENTRAKEFGDLASNLALMLAKPCKRKPRDIAQDLIDKLPETDLLAKVEIAGPGFINFFIDDSWLQRQIEALYRHENLGFAKTAPQTIVVDYSSPNLAKEMHVGHLRSTVIGDAVVRVLEFLGHKVIRQNHVGDWGTQFGMLLAHMRDLKIHGQQLKQSLADLEVFYRSAKARFDEDADFARKARQVVVQLQGGDEEILALWREFNEISLSHCQSIYDRLGVSLSRQDVQGESAYNDDLAAVVADLDARGLLQQDDGAACVFLDEFRNKEGQPLPVIVRKRDGGYLYATTDLAAIRYRVGSLAIDRALYFVDARQALHFEQVFSVARKAGFVDASVSLEHMPFGTVMGEDGRPYKTRSGEVAKLADLLSEAENRAYQLVAAKNPDMGEQQLRQIGSVVGLAAVKYADLSKNRSSDYRFSFDKMLSFDGNTAPYLLYAYTRIQSVFRKLDDSRDWSNSAPLFIEDKEIELANKLLQFSGVVAQVARHGYPNILCNYLYELAVLFSSFYESYPILKAENEALGNSRLKLSSLCADTLKTGLGLLGIDVLGQM